MTKYSILRFFLYATTVIYAHSILTMNVVRPYKFFYNPYPHPGTRWEIFVRPEHGFKARGYNPESCRVNITQIWQNDQDGLAMLDGFDCKSKICLKQIEVDANDDGVRGHLKPSATLNVDFGCTFAARRALPHNIMLGVYMPFFTTHLHNISFIDETGLELAQDQRVHTYLTDNFGQNVQELGCVDIGSYRRTGAGDIAFVADWLQNFPQPRPLLKNVLVNARLGLTLPTGKRENIDKILAFPFGYNGTATIILGGGLTLSYGSYIRAGFDVELRKSAGHAWNQRIKTAAQQTELILLQKATAYIDYAFEQQYTLFAHLHDFVCGTSVKLAYQFFKHGDDTISLCPNNFSNRIASSAQRLQERNWHVLMAIIDFDCAVLMPACPRAIPTVSFYAEIPFKGKRVIVSPILGGIINVDF